MLDIKFIRQNPDLVRQGAIKKRFDVDSDRILELDEQRRTLIFKGDEQKATMNRKSKEIAAAQPEQRGELGAFLKSLKKEIRDNAAALDELTREFDRLMLQVPNVPHEDVPEGKDDADSVEIRRWGEARAFDFEPLDHVELGKKLKILDIERAGRMSGTRNYILRGAGEMLNRAVLSYAMDRIMAKGFEPFCVPVLVRDAAMEGTGFFPNGEDQVYRMEKDPLNLVGTAEVPLTSFFAGEIHDAKDLPIRMAAMSSCFRREAGAAGRDTKGLYRVHQFRKVEQVSICRNDEAVSLAEHAFILDNSEQVLQALELPYRVVNVCGGDLGMPQVQKFDIEAWMPSRESFGETHSASRCHEFQARRLGLRYRDEDGKVHYAHTLNNTVIASPRILIPIMELYQTADGGIEIPAVLRPYMNGLEKISAP